MQQSRIDQMKAAKTIYLQISSSTRMSCGFRQATSGCDKQGRPYLMVRVGSSRTREFLKIALAPHGVYDVTYLDLHPLTAEQRIRGHVESIYADSLSRIIHAMIKV